MSVHVPLRESLLAEVSLRNIRDFSYEIGLPPSPITAPLLTDVLELASRAPSRSEVPPDRALKELHHDAEETPRKRGVPSALGGRIPDERMLSLDLVELPEIEKRRRQYHRKPFRVEKEFETHREQRSALFQSSPDQAPSSQVNMRILPTKDESHLGLAQVSSGDPDERVVGLVAERGRVDVGCEVAETGLNSGVERRSESLSDRVEGGDRLVVRGTRSAKGNGGR